jgi:hypothetical protein
MRNTLKKPIPKNIENKIKKYAEYQIKASNLDNEIRHWLFKNNYDRAMIDMLIDTGQSGDADGFISFLNGEPNEYGQVIDSFYNDNSQMDESDYF